MSAPRVYQTEAIVIKRVDLGEADKIATLYTPHLGKLRAVAKGARRPQSKLGGHVELLTHSQMMLARGRNLDIITQSQTLDSFSPLRNELWRISCGLYLAELVDHFTAERIENPPLFQLLRETLSWLCQAKEGELLLRYFELHLLHYLGYRPQLYYCVRCRSRLQPRVNFFSPADGGVLCPACKEGQPLARPLSVNALKAIRLLQNSDYSLSSKLKVDGELSAELRQVLREYISYLLEREVKSIALLDRLKELEFVG